LKLKARGNNYIKTEYKDGKTEKKRTQKENVWHEEWIDGRTDKLMNE